MKWNIWKKSNGEHGQPRVCVENLHLLSARLHHVGMAVADVGHVVDAVEVGPAGLVVHVLALGPHDLDGVRLEEELAGGPDVPVPQPDGPLLRLRLGRLHWWCVSFSVCVCVFVCTYVVCLFKCV